MMNRKIVVIIVCVCACISCTRTNFTVNQHDLIGFQQTEIPLRFSGYFEDTIPIISVDIEGKTYALVLDTGAGKSILNLTPEAINTLDVKFTGHQETYWDAYGKKYSSKEYLLPSIKLGDLELTDVPCFEDRSPLYDLDGFIGLGFLSNFNMLIDYPGQKLVLYRNDVTPDFLQDPSWFVYKYGKQIGIIAIRVTFDFLDGEYKFGLDTGSNCNVLSKDSDLGKSFQTKLGVTPENVIVDEETQQKYLSYHLDHLYLQTYDLGKSNFVLDKMPDYMKNGLIGFDFFNNNLVYIDFEQKELWLKRVPERVSEYHPN